MLFENVKYLQIQTIDKCNLRCKFCPNRYRPQSGYVMEDDIFEKILQQTKPYLVEDPQIVLHLANEPLLDTKLFDRIQLIKQYHSHPESEVFISSNGVLAEKYKEEIIKHVNIYNFMQYGKNYKKFNNFTLSNISDDRFHKMVSAGDEIVERMNKLNESPNYRKAAKKEIVDFSPKPGKNCLSRAGFLNNWKIQNKSQTVYCKKREPWDYFNFLSNGDMILCCMDYTRESVLGNIHNQTLEEILSSRRAQNMIRKARGEMKSEDNFICKRCEYALSKHV